MVKHTAREELRGVLVFVGVVWCIFVVGLALPFSINSFGVTPRSLYGLVGVPLMPFLHANFNHLLSNTVPLTILLLLLAIPPIHVDQVRDRCRNRLCRQLHRHLANLRRAVHRTTEMQLIVRRDMIAKALSDSMQPDGGYVMLRTGIVAAADFDIDPCQVFRHLSRWKHFSQSPRKSF